MTVSNFHSFCNRILTESAADAGLPPNPDVLDGVRQVLLLRDIRPQLALIYHQGPWWLAQIVQFINRAKDELVTPTDFDAFVAAERQVFEDRYGPYDAAEQRLELQGNLTPLREVRTDYAAIRQHERAEAAGQEPTEYAARRRDQDRRPRGPARRSPAPAEPSTGPRSTRPTTPQIDELADSYVVDGAALEVMRLTELAAVYRAYQAELVSRGALDFGEQIAAVTQLFKVRPNVLRRWQRQFRYLLVDEFQDANVAQIELIEMLGRTPDRPDNVMVVGDDDQSIYRFRGASFAAFSEFDARFSTTAHPRPPRHPARPAAAPPDRAELPLDRRHPGQRQPADRAQPDPHRARQASAHRARGRRPGPAHRVCRPGGRGRRHRRPIRALVGADETRTTAKPRWSDVAILYRKHKHRDAIVARLRDEDIPYTVVGGLSLFETPEIRDLEQCLRAIADASDDVALTRMMTAGPWRLDALEILHVSRMARFDRRHLVDAIRDIVATGELKTDDLARPPNRHARRHRRHRRTTPTAQATPAEPAPVTAPVAPDTRAKLRRLLAVLEELAPLTWRDGPFSILERFIERTGQVLDLIAVGTLDAQRSVTNIASFLRFASDWQGANPNGNLGTVRGLPRRLPRRRRRAAHQRGADRGRRGRPADDPLPGQGARVPVRLRPQPARQRVADPRVRQRLLPDRAAARGRPRR